MFWWPSAFAADPCTAGDREACAALLPSLSASAAAAVALDLGRQPRLRALALALDAVDDTLPVDPDPPATRLIGVNWDPPTLEGWNEQRTDGTFTVLLADPHAAGTAWVSGPAHIAEYPLPADRCGVDVAHGRIAVLEAGCRRVVVHALDDWRVLQERTLPQEAKGVVVGPGDLVVLEGETARWLDDTGAERWSGPAGASVFRSYGSSLLVTGPDVRRISDGAVRTLPYESCTPIDAATVRCWTADGAAFTVPMADPDAAVPAPPLPTEAPLPAWKPAGTRKVTVHTRPGADVWLLRVAREVEGRSGKLLLGDWPADVRRADRRGDVVFADLAAGTGWVVATGSGRTTVPESTVDWAVTLLSRATDPPPIEVRNLPPRCVVEWDGQVLAEAPCSRIGALEPNPDDHPNAHRVVDDRLTFRLFREVRVPNLDPTVDWAAVPGPEGRWAMFEDGSVFTNSAEPVRLVGNGGGRWCATVTGEGLVSVDPVSATPCSLPERTLAVVDPSGAPMIGEVGWDDPETGSPVRARSGLDGALAVPAAATLRSRDGVLDGDRLVVAAPPQVAPGWIGPVVGTWVDPHGQQLVLEAATWHLEPEPTRNVERIWAGGALLQGDVHSTWFLLTSDDTAIGWDEHERPVSWVRVPSDTPVVLRRDRDRTRCTDGRLAPCQRLVERASVEVARAVRTGDARWFDAIDELTAALLPLIPSPPLEDRGPAVLMSRLGRGGWVFVDADGERHPAGKGWITGIAAGPGRFESEDDVLPLCLDVRVHGATRTDRTPTTCADGERVEVADPTGRPRMAALELRDRQGGAHPAESTLAGELDIPRGWTVDGGHTLFERGGTWVEPAPPAADPVDGPLEGTWIGPNGWTLAVTPDEVMSWPSDGEPVRWARWVDWTGGSLLDGGMLMLASPDLLVLVGDRPTVFARQP